MKGLMKAAKVGDPYLDDPMEGVEKQEENLEVSMDKVEKAMKPSIGQSEGKTDKNLNVHDSDDCNTEFRTFTSTQKEMGEIG